MNFVNVLANIEANFTTFYLAFESLWLFLKFNTFFKKNFRYIFGNILAFNLASMSSIEFF